MFLGIDVGGTKMASGLVDYSGRILHRGHEATDQSSMSSAADQLVRIVQQYEELYPEIQTAGIAIPGISDSKRGTVWAPNIRGWDHLHLVQLLRERSKITIHVESDRNAMVLAEKWFGCAQGIDDIIFLILGTGIGAGILSGGHLIRGNEDIGGAVGWMPIEFKGKIYHFEQIAAGPSIARHGAEIGLSGELPKLSEDARYQNKLALELFEEIGSVIGKVISSLISIFNPELVIIGGGVSNAWDLLEPSAHQAIIRWTQPIAKEKVKLKRCTFGNDTGIYGAAAVAADLVESGGNIEHK